MGIDAGDDRQLLATDAGVGSDEAESIVEEFLSVLASNWVTALEPHLGVLMSLDAPSPAEAHEVSHVENAHAVAAAAMLVFALESNAARLAAIGRSPVNVGLDARALDVIKSVLADRGADAAAVIELFVLRDVLVHDHIWEVRLKRGADWSRPASLLAAELRHGRITDKKYADVAVDEGTNRTLRLRLHLVPTEVRRWDISQLLPVACAVFDGLAARDVENMRSLADQSLKISSGGLTSLRKLIPLLRVVEVGSAQ